MKKLCALMLAILAAGNLAAQSSAGSGNAAEISFKYVRQNSGGSNQFAVWIEDAAGRHVRTLVATRYTAQGGWQRRPESIPQWVRRSGLARMSRSEIDALTGVTPGPGFERQTFRWDGRDSGATLLPQGEYRVLLEATLRNENRVLYTATIRPGSGAGEVPVQCEYFGNSSAERGMISEVKVQTLR